MRSIAAGIVQLLFILLLYALGILIMGLAIFPGILLCYHIWMQTPGYPAQLRILFLCIAIAAAYFIYGFSLILLVGLLRVVFRLKLKEAELPMVSAGTAKWVFTNAVYLVVVYTFMDFILLTPFAPLFYRIMGAEVGRNVQINSRYCADLSLLEIGDGAVIGGHATVICHSFERGKLILKKVKIGKKAVIGLNSVILPGAEIGEGAHIAAGAVLPKDTKVEPGSVYSGIPARPI
jgi:hypothetical protein